MKMRGIEFGHVFNASGARGFNREGYWFHKLFKFFGLDYSGSTFIAKTTTLNKRIGNMQLDSTNKPKSLLPDCIIVKPLAGVVLNAVGLSGPGAADLLRYWSLYDNFVFSFMSVEDTTDKRLNELQQFVKLVYQFNNMAVQTSNLRRSAIQLNFSCPNVGLSTLYIINEVTHAVKMVEHLKMPIMIKINALVDPSVMVTVSQLEEVDAIVCSNTIPWGALPDKIDWVKLFGSRVSPLFKYGGGGLSGKPLLPIVEEWIKTAREYGITKPIVGCGGVLSKQDTDRLINAGASAIELGSVSILRPWRVAGIIKHINKVMESNVKIQN